MPKQGDVDHTYPDLLETENKIQLLEPFKGAKAHHLMRCLVCSHEWVATPLSKRQTLKKYGVGGCPACNESAKQAMYAEHRRGVIQDLLNRGVEILDPTYDGRLRLDYNGRVKDEQIHVRNVNCGHEFFVSPGNLIRTKITCSVCGVVERSANLTQTSLDRSAKWQLTATEWQKYKTAVTSITEQNYRLHQHGINPDNHPLGLAGIAGAYHLDHTIPKRWCFDNGIPPEICGHQDNLQFLPWFDNVSQRNHLKEQPVPSIFRDYVVETIPS